MFSQTAFALAQRIFPGPFTLVVPATREVPKLLTDAKRRTVGIRVPSHPIAQALAQRIFPGPYTLVVPATRTVPRTLTDEKRRTVGIRVTSHPITQALARGLGRPLLTTSAIVPEGRAEDAPGPEAHEPCRDADDILAVFEKFVDVVIDAEQTPAEPSTVIEVNGEDIKLIRQGQGSLEGILDIEEVPAPERAAGGRRR